MRLITWVRRALLGMIGGFVVCLVAFVVIARLTEMVVARGTVAFDRYQHVRAAAAGHVVEIAVRPGETVRAGQLLARVDMTEVEQRLHELMRELEELEMEAGTLTTARENRSDALEVLRQEGELGRLALQQAEAAAQERELVIRRAEAAKRVGRVGALAKAGLISATESEQAQAELAIVDAELQSARAAHARLRSVREVEEQSVALLRDQWRHGRGATSANVQRIDARRDLLRRGIGQLRAIRDRGTVRAAVDGVVVGPERNELLGRHVAAGDPLFTVVDPTTVRFVAMLNESGVIRVKPGQEVLVEINGIPRSSFHRLRGTVEQVAAASETDAFPARVRLAQAWVPVEGQRVWLRSGMTGNVRIVYRYGAPLFEHLWHSLTA